MPNYEGTKINPYVEHFLHEL